MNISKMETWIFYQIKKSLNCALHFQNFKTYHFWAEVPFNCRFFFAGLFVCLFVFWGFLGGGGVGGGGGGGEVDVYCYHLMKARL